jgi:hypothetical protein
MLTGFAARARGGSFPSAKDKNSNAGRKSSDVIVMFGCWRCNRSKISPAGRASIKCAAAGQHVSDVYADNVYRLAGTEAKLKARRLRGQIH